MGISTDDALLNQYICARAAQIFGRSPRSRSASPGRGARAEGHGQSKARAIGLCRLNKTMRVSNFFKIFKKIFTKFFDGRCASRIFLKFSPAPENA